MQFTEYGKALSRNEDIPVFQDGAAGHAQACGYDSGLNILLTGEGITGRFTMKAGSVLGAFMKARAAWGVERAWHIREDGTRKLIFRR